MIEIVPIAQGEDTEVEIAIDDPTAIDLDTTIGMLCYIYNKRDEVVAKFSKNAKTGHTLLTVTNASAGIFKIKLQSEVTATLDVATQLFAEIKLSFEMEGWTDDDFFTVSDNHYVGTIIKSVTAGVTPA